MGNDLSSPHELMSQIEADARSLDAGARRLSKAIHSFAIVQATYERAFEEQIILIRDDARHSGERMPAEDVRKAIAHHAVDHEIYAAFLSKEAEIEALKSWTRNLVAMLSAKQTLLNALRDELRVA